MEGTGDKTEVVLLRQQLELERKKLEDERKQLEREKKKQEDEFMRLKDEFYRKQQVEENKKKEVESLCQKLSQERQLLEDERKRLLLSKSIQEDEYLKMQEQFQRQAHLGQDTRVPDPTIHSIQAKQVPMVQQSSEEHRVLPDTSAVRTDSPNSTPSTSPSSTKPRIKAPSTKQDLVCVVCGDKANGMHFKALTCEGCKVFFRRNSKKQDSLKCHSENGTVKGKCEMDLYMRRHCAYCRMKKCLEVGMEVGRVWDKERCKSRKQIKKTPVTSSSSVAPGDENRSTSSSSSGGGTGASPTSSTKLELTEEQKQLMTLVNDAFVNAMKIKLLPNGTTATLSEIRKNRLTHLGSKQQDSELTLSLFESMGNMAGGDMMEVSYLPSSYAQSMWHSNGVDTSNGCLNGTGDSTEDKREDDIPFDEAMFKHCMEIIVIALKELIAFVKGLPGFLDLSCEDQAALVKETFLDFMVLKTAGFYNAEVQGFCAGELPGEVFKVSDIQMGGFKVYMKSLLPFCEKTVKLKLTRQEHAVLLAICLLTPDRHVLSDDAKLSISSHHEKLVEALYASASVNHPDETQFFPKVVGLLTQLRDCTESFMDEMRRLKLEGQSIQPILSEIFEM